MTTRTEANASPKEDALKLALEALEGFYEYGYDRRECFEHITAIKEALSELEQDDEVLGFNGWGFPIEKPSQPEQEPVAWRYKPARENNPRWEYTTEHPLDMGDGYLRPSLVEYCKCIEPLYAREKPKLMLEKFREMNDLLDDTTPPQHALMAEHWKAEYDKLKAACKPLTDDEIMDMYNEPRSDAEMLEFARAIEAAHNIKE